MTNLEKIRQMDALDLAQFLDDISGSCHDLGRGWSNACEDCPLNDKCSTYDETAEWLESEVEGGAE